MGPAANLNEAQEVRLAGWEYLDSSDPAGPLLCLDLCS